MKEHGKKTLARKLLVAMLTVTMAVTFIPTSLFVFADEPDSDADVVQNEVLTEDVVQDEEQTEEVQEDVQTEDVVQDEEQTEEVQAEPTEAVEEEAVTETEEAQPEDSEQEEVTEENDEPEDAVKTHFVKEVGGITVTVDAAEGSFDKNVDLVVIPFKDCTPAYWTTERVLKNNGQIYEGLVAFDIHFEDSNGNEVEPANEVSVKVAADNAALEGISADVFNAESVQITHVVSNGTEVVADADATSGIAGTVKVSATEEAVEKIKAEFAVDEFSTFALTWNNDQEATIHWGMYQGDGSFKEFDDSVSIDTTAASVDLALPFSGYYFVAVNYQENEDVEPQTIEDVKILKKTDGVWKLGDTTVAEGSDIYVGYAPKNSNVYSSRVRAKGTTPPEDFPSPETTKTVTKNSDGTYTIQLDIEGKQKQVQEQTGANVIIIMDVTQSMSNPMGSSGSRMDVAQNALTTLINTLDPDKNDIHFTAVNFGNSADYYNGVNWTTAKSDMLNYVDSLTTNDFGTCWQAGLEGGTDRTETAPEGNKTYAIFVTDGNPNGWVENGVYQQRGAGEFVLEAYEAAVDPAIDLAKASNFYGIFCGDDEGAEHLKDLIKEANGGSDSNFVDGSTPSAVEAAFNGIASTILKDLGASNVTVDDGVPSLTNVSANVTAGEAGGFEYYITPKGGSQKEWSDAPEAEYDKSNGVKWDLGNSMLEDGYVYTLKFTVWPSQEAYDLIADLNNGLKEYDDLPAEQQEAIEGSKEEGYRLKTNTHLFTTFTDGENEYQIDNDAGDAAMELTAETISVKKIWNNDLDQRTASDGVKLKVTKDGEEYLTDVEVSNDNDWSVDGIYISCGQIKKSSSGYTVLETGHDYAVTEPEELSYHWELSSDIFRPMVINGKSTLLIQDDSASGTDGEDYYVIEGHKYVKSSEGDSELTAVNDRRSWLQLEKKVEGDNAPADAKFTFAVTIDIPSGEDVWFSAYDPEAGDTVKDLNTSATAEEGDTGYFYAASGSEITMDIEAGWTVRFTNLPSDTTYTISEDGIPEGFTFTKAESSTVKETSAEQDEPEEATIDGSTVTGTINVPNCEFYVDYTNGYGVGEDDEEEGDESEEVATGDNNNIILFVLILILSVLGFTGAFFIRRRFGDTL